MSDAGSGRVSLGKRPASAAQMANLCEVSASRSRTMGPLALVAANISFLQVGQEVQS